MRERFRNLKKQFKFTIPIMLGSAIYAFGLHYFVISNELMEGGVTGIALLIHYAFYVQPSITTLLLNIPLFFIGWKWLGGTSMFLTIVGTVSLSFFLWVMEVLISHHIITPFHTTQDYFLATLYAGVTSGIGLGIVFRYGGTTGGADIIARLFNKFNSWSMGQIILSIDMVVIGLSLFYIPREKILYTLVMVFVASKVIDYISEGSYSAKAFTVVSNHADHIAAIITKELERGVTLFKAVGAYSKTDKEVIYCVVSRQELRRMINLIRSIDPDAFIVIHHAQDVIGEGFRPV